MQNKHLSYTWNTHNKHFIIASQGIFPSIVASEAAKEAVWMRNFLMDLGVVQGSSNPLDVYCDNNGSIAQAKEPRQHQKNKHILMRYHLIHQFVDQGDIKLCKVHTDANIADLLTKPLP